MVIMINPGTKYIVQHAKEFFRFYVNQLYKGLNFFFVLRLTIINTFKNISTGVSIIHSNLHYIRTSMSRLFDYPELPRWSHYL